MRNLARSAIKTGMASRLGSHQSTKEAYADAKYKQSRSIHFTLMLMFDSYWLSNTSWQALKHDFDSSLDTIITLLSTKNDSFLEATYYDTDFKDYYPYSFVLYGMLHHDLYHLGQIGIIIKHLKGWAIMLLRDVPCWLKRYLKKEAGTCKFLEVLKTSKSKY